MLENIVMRKLKNTNPQFSIFQSRLQSERFNILKNLVRLHFTIPPLRHKRCYELQANDRILRLRQEMLIWSVYTCNLLRGRTLAKVKVTAQKIVRALWLAIKPSYMSVCKHGFRSSFISYFIKEM